MVSIESIPGGPLAGLPTFVLSLGPSATTLPSTQRILSAIEPFMPPIMHFTMQIGGERIADSALTLLVNSLRSISLHVAVDAYGSVDPWMQSADSITLFTSDMRTHERANIIVFVTDTPPTLWRPLPHHLARMPMLFWSAKKPSVDEIAELPTGMRLWNCSALLSILGNSFEEETDG
jgi:hypothetical protein